MKLFIARIHVISTTYSYVCMFTCVSNHEWKCVCFFQGQIISHQMKAATILVSSAYKWQNNPFLVIENKTWGEGSDCWWLSLCVRHKPKGNSSFTPKFGIWQQLHPCQSSLCHFSLAPFLCVWVAVEWSSCTSAQSKVTDVHGGWWRHLTEVWSGGKASEWMRVDLWYSN